MFWVRKIVWSGLVWLTAAMTLVAGMPRLACACAPGSSRAAAAAPQPCACACGGACCQAPSHFCSTGSSPSKTSLQRGSSDGQIPAVAANGRSVCKTVLAQLGPVTALEGKQPHDLGTIPLG